MFVTFVNIQNNIYMVRYIYDKETHNSPFNICFLIMILCFTIFSFNCYLFKVAFHDTQIMWGYFSFIKIFSKNF